MTGRMSHTTDLSIQTYGSAPSVSSKKHKKNSHLETPPPHPFEVNPSKSAMSLMNLILQIAISLFDLHQHLIELVLFILSAVKLKQLASLNLKCLTVE